MALSTETLKLKARRAYEVARLRQALALSLPVWLVGGMVVVLVREISMPLIGGTLLYLASVTMLWWGRDPGRSVLPGVAYGLLPLTGAVLAKLHHHVCMGFSCYSTCLLYCLSGGVIVGLLVSRLARKSDAPGAMFLSAAATALLTGAIGSSCVGVHGIVGMTIGVTIGAIPFFMRRLAQLRAKGSSRMR